MNTTNVDGFWSLQLRVDEDNGERIVIEKEAEVLIDSRITVRLTTNNQRREEKREQHFLSSAEYVFQQKRQAICLSLQRSIINQFTLILI